MSSYSISPKGIFMLMRFTALIYSGAAAALSTYIPLALFYDVPFSEMFKIFFILVIGIFLIQAILTHTYNEIADYESGTDLNSPALMSGGARVIVDGEISLKTMRIIALVTTFLVFLLIIISLINHAWMTAFLLFIGWFAAYSYSLPPLRFAYRPFLSEIFSLFPAVFFLTLAAPLLALGEAPSWAIQNALVNGFWFLGWVMISAVNDIEADRKATPKKLTTPLFFTDKFGKMSSLTPSMIYFICVAIVGLWILFTRPVAGIGVLICVGFVIYKILQMNPHDPKLVAHHLKHILYGAGIVAIWLIILI